MVPGTMRLNISPVIPYLVGAMLVVFGALRAKYLATPRPPKLRDEEDQSAAEATAIRGKEEKRHLRMGVVWILLGVFLLISTYWQTRPH
jgi:di/tricarboxylate transporter